MPGFTIKFGSTVIDLEPHLKFRNGAYESPSLAASRIIKEHYPQYLDEYNEFMEERKARLDRFESRLNHHKNNWK